MAANRQVCSVLGLRKKHLYWPLSRKSCYYLMISENARKNFCYFSLMSENDKGARSQL